MTTLRTTLAPAALLGAAALVLTGCSTGPADAEAEGTRTTEAASAEGDRIVLTYDGGLLTLDQDLRVVADDSIDGFTRVNPAGDGRHVLVTCPRASGSSTPPQTRP